jgi:DNA repair protein RadC
MERFRKEGLDGFNDIQALELILFFSIPRRDTNELAHQLLDRFGSLSRVMDASQEELMEVPGVGLNTATLLRLVKEGGRFYQVDRAKRDTLLPTMADCARYLMPFFLGKQQEMVYLLCLDAGCNAVACREVGAGDVNAAVVSPRRVVELALAEKASSVVLAHNHPSGVALPSAEDVNVTRRLAAALAAVDVVLLDHLIVADNDYVSLVESKLFPTGNSATYR